MLNPFWACVNRKALYYSLDVKLKLFPDYQPFIFQLFSTMKYTIKILPDVEKDLNSGDIKHRKHPGVRKMPPVKIPKKFKEAIYRLIANEREKIFLQNAQQLCKTLAHRKLPIEMQEIESRISETAFLINEHGENLPEIVKKKRILQLKKHLQMDIGQWKQLKYDHTECLTYLAGRAVPNYASTYNVFSEIKNRIPDFEPKTFFDFGSGIGSAMWAAHSIWNTSIKEYYCVDSSPDMIEVSQNILTEENTEEMFIKNVHYRQFLPASDSIKYDLVVSAFSLLDLSSVKDRLQVIDTLWRKTSGVLVIIEYGNWAGFSCVVDARDFIIHMEKEFSKEKVQSYSTGAHVVCPCPHEFSCPKFNSIKDPCGLPVRYETIFPRHSFKCKKDWISYVVLRKGSRPESDTSWPRLVKPVLKKSKHVYCRLCCKDGQLHEVIVTKAKHGRHAYRSARCSSIGDLIPGNVELLTNEIEFPDELAHENSDSESDEEENA